MHDDAATAIDDTGLLRRFTGGGDEGAFRILVERYTTLVYTAALRVAGDADHAEDITQEVFILLAKKPPDGSGFPSLAGWLHRAAVLVAQHHRRQHKRRRLREHHAAMNTVPDSPGDAEQQEILPVLDEALQRLPGEDCEALVRRYFHGDNLREVGRVLHTSEDAARMRINRALERLRGFLARRGITSTSAVLTAALESQTRALGAAPAGLVQNASTAALTTHQLTAPQLAIAATLMTASKTPILITAAIALLCLTAGVFLGRTLLKPEPDSTSAPVTSAVPRRAVPADNSDAPAADELARVQAELEREKAARGELEKSYAALKSQTEPLKDEVVIAYGKVGEIGQNFGDLFKEARELIEIEKKGELKTPSGTAKLVAFMKKAASLGGLSQEIIGFEDNPAEGSRFQSSTYKSVFGLTDAEQKKVESYFEKTMTEARDLKLTLSNLPAHDSPDFKPWLEKRWEFFNATRPQLLEAIPEARRADFESWVESGGYGFKNLTLGGGPLMFSLGGQPDEKAAE